MLKLCVPLFRTLRRNSFQILRTSKVNSNNVATSVRLYNLPVINELRSKYFNNQNFVTALSILSWLGFSSDDDDKESELIMTLKRSVLCIRREQFEKAERMLHLALRLAQQQQNEQGVIYCYDLMANLAFDTVQLDKAEKLFVSVLQMLFSKGMKQDDLKAIHISLKLARINQLKSDLPKAELGYKWCMDTIAKQKNDSEDAKMLYGVIEDWYAQFLLDKGDVPNSLIHLKEAYRICNEMSGNSEPCMLLLNDLAITSFRAGDSQTAKTYLEQAIEIGNKIEDKTHLGVVHANLGLILLHNGVLKEAEKYCEKARQLGKKHENKESIEQANYCFDQIKLNLEN